MNITQRRHILEDHGYTIMEETRHYIRVFPALTPDLHQIQSLHYQGIELVCITPESMIFKTPQ